MLRYNRLNITRNGGETKEYSGETDSSGGNICEQGERQG